MDFLHELKRRNVYKVGAAYAVVAWLLIQVASILLPTFEAPSWVMKVLIALVAAGFPIALVLAWAFELTPEGVVRTEEAGGGPQRRPRRRWMYVVLVGAALSVGVFFLGRYTADLSLASSLAGASKSIAVLPLVNQSGDAEQEYFSDGLTEELINGLGRIPELKVIGRNSSFHFKGKAGDARAIAQALGVAHLLEGSVRKAGERIRVAVQLVNAADGSQRWSETYNRELKDIFAVQEEIARAVADRLRVTLLGSATAVASQPSNQNLSAYNAFLQAKYHFEKTNPAAAAAALPFVDEAIRLDPNYAEAYVLKARALSLIGVRAGVPGREKLEQARVAAQAALALKPDLPGARAAMAYIYLFTDWNIPAAETELSGVSDKSAYALNGRALLRLIQGRMEESIALREEAVRVEPLHAASYTSLGNTYARVNRLADAEAAARRALELQPTISGAHGLLSFVAILRGDLDVALREAELEQGAFRSYVIILAQFARGERAEGEAAFGKLLEQLGDISPAPIADAYAILGDTGKTFEWLERAYTLREPGLIQSLSWNPFYARHHADPRMLELCRKIGRPVPQ